jgi:anionic cell wall polymer biosynthesis LytR-Cps2A-Psr (LCP) family protein
MASAAAALPRFPERFNLLLLGLDRRDRRGILATGAEIPLEQLKRIPARSDVIMVIQFDFLEQQIRIVNIPRDTRLRVGGRGGWKINAAYAFGRERLARKVVADFLDLPIHRCVVADWRGAKQCIALFKGLNFDYQGFSEKDIFWHLRKRSFARGDFQRIERQQRFLNFAAGEYLRLYRQVRSASGAAGMVRQGILEMAIKQALAAVETDLGYDEMRLLTYAFRDYDPARMVMTQVPGVGVLEGGSAEGGGIYYLSPTPRHSFKDLIYRAESKGMAGNSGPSPIYSNMD